MQGNLDHTGGSDFHELKPYMLYGDRSVVDQMPKMQDGHMIQDLEYLQGMYPGHMKRIQEYVMAACDRLDYKNSPLYDEFPDRLMVNQMCASICRKITADGILKGSGLQVQKTSEETGEENAEAVEEIEEVEVYEVGDKNALEQDWRIQQVMPPGPQSWGPLPRLQPPRPPQGAHYPNPPRPCPRPQCPPPVPPHNSSYNWLNDIVKILLLNEMYRRRCHSGFCL